MPHALIGQLFPTPPFDFDKSLDFLGFFAPMEGEQSLAGRALTKAVLIDGRSEVGRAYAAKTTPHMFVIDPAGKVVYAGAIDDRRSANPADAKAAKNFVTAALTEAKAGKPVTVASTTPYGCSVKY